MGMKKTGAWLSYGFMLNRAAHTLAGNIDTAVGRASVKLSSFMKKNLTDQGQTAGKPFEPLKPSTIARKGSSLALIDTGTGRNSIMSTKLKQFEYLTGIPGTAQGGEGVAVWEYMKAHEEGFISKSGHLVPARPWMQPTVDKKGPELIKEIDEEIKRETFRI